MISQLRQITNMRNTFKEVVSILADRLGLNAYNISKITPDTNVLDMCDDSLDLLDAVMALEDHFDVNIPSPEKFQTIGELHKFIAGELNA